MLVSFEAVHLYISLVLLAIALFALRVRGKSMSYLFFCTIFGIYLIGVVSVVIFPIHIPDRAMEINWKLHINLTPFHFGRCDFLLLCLRAIFQNILLTTPFGFGIQFLYQIKHKNILWLAITVGFVLELAQLTISVLLRSSFRVVDINDIFLNAIGVLLGYGLFRIFGWLYLYIVRSYDIRNKGLLAYIYAVTRQSADR